MKNEFYNSLDLETWGARNETEGEHRSPFQVDRDRIVFSSAFRALQSKTQVFRPGEYDFYRNRLTHSLEVSRIARSIAERFNATSPLLAPGFHIDADLVEAIGFAHDLGHPPFGHIGERKLNELMAGHGGFEGNAQTLRILTDTIFERKQQPAGMAPTRALLDGVLKYRSLRRERILGEDERRQGFAEHHFLYDFQADVREFVHAGEPVPADLVAAGTLDGQKSIECQVMDWADDAAYCLHDIADGFRASFLNETRIRAWAEGLARPLEADELDCLERLLRVMRQGTLDPYCASRIGAFIQASTLERHDDFLAHRTNRHRFRVRVDEAARRESRLYKRIAFGLIFRSPQIQQVEFKGGQTLAALFNALIEHALGDGPRRLQMLPLNLQRQIDATSDEFLRRRLVCDHIAALTDPMAVRFHRRLFDPGYGTINDLF